MIYKRLDIYGQAPWILNMDIHWKFDKSNQLVSSKSEKELLNEIQKKIKTVAKVVKN